MRHVCDGWTKSGGNLCVLRLSASAAALRNTARARLHSIGNRMDARLTLMADLCVVFVGVAVVDGVAAIYRYFVVFRCLALLPLLLCAAISI